VAKLEDRYFTGDVDVVDVVVQAGVHQRLSGCGERASAVQ
jgi:hypothetical protein